MTCLRTLQVHGCCDTLLDGSASLPHMEFLMWNSSCARSRLQDALVCMPNLTHCSFSCLQV